MKSNRLFDLSIKIEVIQKISIIKQINALLKVVGVIILVEELS